MQLPWQKKNWDLMKKFNIGLFSLLFIAYCGGYYNPTSWFIGFLLFSVVLHNVIEIGMESIIKDLREVIDGK